jgi:hypothetical protein
MCNYIQKGALVYMLRCRYGYYSYRIHRGTCGTGGERGLHIDVDTGK